MAFTTLCWSIIFSLHTKFDQPFLMILQYATYTSPQIRRWLQLTKSFYSAKGERMLIYIIVTKLLKPVFSLDKSEGLTISSLY